MTKNKIEDLNLSKLNKEVKRMDSWAESFVDVNGSMYSIKVKEHFKETEIQNVMKDFADFVQFALEAKETDNILALAKPYTTVLFFKHFTSLDVPNDVFKALKVYDNLLDLGLMKKIVSLLPDDQMIKVTTRVNEVVESVVKNIEESEIVVPDSPVVDVVSETEAEIEAVEKAIDETPIGAVEDGQ